MKKRRILVTGILSALLLTATLSAHTMHCKNGKCFIDISKLSPSRSAESKVDTFKAIKKVNFTTNISKDSSTIVLDHSTYIMSENEQNNYLIDSEDTSNTEAEDTTENTIVLEPSKYVMNEAEKEIYNMNERLEQAELEKNLIIPIITFEDKVSKEVILPHSELYCDDAKLAVFHPATNYYECV